MTEVLKHSRELNEVRDCAVRAVAVATGVHYVNVHSLMAHYGRKPRHGTKATITYRVLKHLGFHVEHTPVKSKTVCSIERELKTGTYLVWVKKHVLAIKDGVVCDWTQGKKHRIKRVERVIYG